VFDFGVHLTAIDAMAIALVACSPGILAGLALGAFTWRAHRMLGAAIGAAAGFALNAIVLSVWYGGRLPTGGIARLGACSLFT
jgi:hypothetical protein